MQPILNTTRLLLRPLVSKDRPLLGEVFKGIGVRRYLFDNEEVSAEMLDIIMEESLRQAKDGLGLWLIVHGGNAIGCVGLHRDLPQSVKTFPAFTGEIEVVIALVEEQWGEGYATEAVGAALAYAADALNARRIVTLVDAPNERSHQLMQRCGFRRIGSAQGPLYMNIAYERMI